MIESPAIGAEATSQSHNIRIKMRYSAALEGRPDSCFTAARRCSLQG
jgi:hypothetical protein